MPFKKLSIAACIATSMVLGGCAVGRTYDYAETPMKMASVSTQGTVAVAVRDERPYVLSGNKPARFVGLMRGGFGNPFDVNTSSGKPLAQDIEDAIVRSMKERGITAVPVAVAADDTPAAIKRKLQDAKARRAVLVTLKEWKSDTYMNTDLHYDATLAVLDESGKQLAHSWVRGTDNLGSLGLSPDEGIAKASARKLDKLFGQEKVSEALK